MFWGWACVINNHQHWHYRKSVIVHDCGQNDPSILINFKISFFAKTNFYSKQHCSSIAGKELPPMENLYLTESVKQKNCVSPDIYIPCGSEGQHDGRNTWLDGTFFLLLLQSRKWVAEPSTLGDEDWKPLSVGHCFQQQYFFFSIVDDSKKTMAACSMAVPFLSLYSEAIP